MNPSLTEVLAFLAVAERGGFSSAARELGVTQSTISRRIAGLEAKTGVRLIMRTTRQVSLTEGGSAYAQELRDVLSTLRDAHAKVRNGASEPEGLVRITMPTALGRTRVMPCIARLAERYPKLRFDLDLSDRYVDMLDGTYDIAVRLADSHRSGLRTQRIGSFQLGLYASSGYARSQGLPASPQELASHDVLALRTYSPRTEWRAAWQGQTVAMQIDPRITVTDSFVLKSLSLAGTGIVMLPSYLIDDEVTAGALVQVMAGLVFAERDVFVTYFSHRAELSKVQVVIDALGTCMVAG